MRRAVETKQKKGVDSNAVSVQRSSAEGEQSE